MKGKITADMIANMLVEGKLDDADVYAYQFLIACKDRIKNEELVGLELSAMLCTSLNKVAKVMKEVK